MTYLTGRESIERGLPAQNSVADVSDEFAFKLETALQIGLYFLSSEGCFLSDKWLLSEQLIEVSFNMSNIYIMQM